MTKSRLHEKQLCLPNIIFKVKNYRDKFRKTISLNSYQKPQLQSILIFFNFAHLYLLFIVLCHLNHP